MNSHGYDEQDLTRTNLPPKIPVLENISFLGVDGKDIRNVDQYASKNVDEFFGLVQMNWEGICGREFGKELGFRYISLS